MKYIMDYEGKPYRKYFEEICAIPHGSWNEKQISEYIIQFAKDRDLWWYTDEIWNVVVKKPASKGYEDHPPVMLQAHTDMVCVKAEGSNFNFETDPLQLYIEDGWIKAKDTTLGADCAHGLAYMLAILDDKTLAHPPLECFFSVQEEVGIGGPKFIDYSVFTAKKLLNFDQMTHGTVYLSATHVDGGNLHKKLRKEKNSQPTFKLTIGGGTGGHGGIDIGKDRVNAIKLCINILYRILMNEKIYMVSITGGTARNNLAGSCEAVFVCAGSNLEQLKAIADKIFTGFLNEYAETDPDLYMKFESVATSDERFDDLSSRGLIELLFVIPVGAKIRRPLPEGGDYVVSSKHMGKIAIEGDTAVFTYQLRSCLDTQMSEMLDETQLLADRYGAVYERVIHYPGYKSYITDPLHTLYAQVYKEATGKDIHGVQFHAGTDVGTIVTNIPGMDLTTIGPDTIKIHTPEEAMRIESFDQVYEYTKTVLARL